MSRTLCLALSSLLLVAIPSLGQPEINLEPGQAVAAGWGSSQRAPGGDDALRELAEPLAAGQEAGALRLRWLDRVAAGRGRVGSLESSGDAPVSARPDGQTLGLVGSNLAIASYADDVSRSEALGWSSIGNNYHDQQFMVTWQARSRTTDIDVFGRVASKTGTTQGAIFAVSQDAGVQVAPSVVYDYSARQYFVAWTDFGTGDTGAIRLRRFSTTGTPLGNVITVSAAGTSGFAARVAYGGERCVVAWVNELANGTTQVLARAYDSSGVAAGGPVVVSGTGVIDYPDIAYTFTGGTFLVVWEQAVNGWADVIARGVTPALALSPQMTISNASGHQRYPRIAYSSKCACFLVTWQDGRTQTSWNIWGQRVSANLQLAGGGFDIYSGTYNEYDPAPAGLATTSQFAVAYTTDLNGGGLLQIHCCLVSGFGGVVTRFPVREWNNQRRNAAVAGAYGADEYLITWTDDAHQTSADILGRVVNTFGNFVAPQVAIARGRKGQEAPTLAYNPARNEYLVVWMDYRSGSDYQIWGRRVSGTGVLVGSEIVIGNEATSILYGLPAVAYNPATDEYLVVWHEIHSQAVGYDVYGRRVGATGTLLAPPFLVSRDSGAGNEGTPRVVYIPGANQFLVGWNAYDHVSTKLYRVWGQRVSAAGALSGSGFLMSASTGWCSPPRLAVNATANEVLAIWEDFRNQSDNIWGQRVSGAGGLAGPNVQISASTGSKVGFSAAWGGVDHYLVAWGDTRAGDNVYGQRVAGNGVLSGAELAVASQTGLVEAGPAVEVDSKNGGFVVGWQQPGTSTDLDIWGRLVPADGPPAGPSFALTTAADTQNLVELEEDGNGKFLYVWQDFRAGSYDVYGQRLQVCPLTTSASVPATATVGTALWFSSSTDTGACVDTVYWDWDFGDGTAHGTTQNAKHTFTAAGTYTWRLTVSTSGGQSWTKTGTITVTGSTTCTLTCSASVPTSGSANVPLAFSASALVSGCTSPVAYDWDFGDGSAHATTQDASHAYTAGGSFAWRMTATAGTATCARNGTVQISGPTRLWVPVVSRAKAYVGGWRSDLGILNRSSSTAAQVSLVVRAGGQTYTGNVTVPAKGQEILRDVALLLGLESGSGSLELSADQPVLVTSRTYNLQENGLTFGQGYDAIAVRDGLAAGQSAFVAQLTQNGSSGQVGTYRSNIGLTNLGTGTARVKVDLLDNLGTQVWTSTIDLSPGQWHQYNEPYRTGAQRNDIAKGYARITVVSGASVFAYGSVLDNGSSDPTTIVMRSSPPPPASGPNVTWVPVVSHAGGHTGGWRSDVGILNQAGSGSASVALTLRSGVQSYTGNVTVPAGAQEIIRDTALLLGLSSGSGSLELSADRPVIVTSRTFNLQDTGWTYGQGYDGFGVAEGLGAGRSGYLAQLTQNGSPGQVGTYRTNIGITNLGTTTANVTLVLYDQAGNQVYTTTRNLTPGQWYQYNEPYRTGAQRNDIAKGYGKIIVNSGSSVLAYASVIDNASSDPTTIMMRE